MVDDRLRLTGNLAALTDDLKETLRNHKPAILELLSVSTYPNPDGMVKCCYCTHLDGYRCTRGYHPGGTALLRECSDFSFERKDQQHENKIRLTGLARYADNPRPCKPRSYPMSQSSFNMVLHPVRRGFWFTAYAIVARQRDRRSFPRSNSAPWLSVSAIPGTNDEGRTK